MSAIVGQDWRPKTYRELLVQWEGKLLSDWAHTAAFRGCFANKDASYSDLHPYWKKTGQTAGNKSIVLKPKKLFTYKTHNEYGERVSIMEQMNAPHTV